MDQGAAIQFSAAVSGITNQAVTWNLQEGSVGGSITQNGLYTAPTAEMKVHVVATSAADPSKSAKSEVTVNPVSIYLPPTIALPRGRQRQLTAVVWGTVLKDVTWTIQEGSTGGTITADGLYTAPMSGGSFHVTARSVGDPSKEATAVIVLTDAGFRMLSSSTLTPRWNHTATLLPDGRVLVAGGYQCDKERGVCDFYALSSAELFDPVTETFSATGAMSVPRAGHTATLLDNGKVLITGGTASAFDPATAEVYDSTTGTFTATGDMGKHRSGQTVTSLGNGLALVAGGLVLQTNPLSWVPTKTAQLYDPATQTFSSVEDLPVVQASHTANVLLNGDVFMAGGAVGACPAVQTTVAIYHPDSNTFSPGVNLPEPRVLHTATTLNDGRVLITGGTYDYCVWDTPTWDVAYDTAVIFDPATSSYTPEQLMRERRWGHSATLLTDGKVLVVGATAELFDPATSSFVITGDPSAPSLDGFRTATRLSDGRVLFVGSTSLAEIYE